MADDVQQLEEILAPVREGSVAALLTAQARAIDAGADIDPEPLRRDPSGRVKRQGRLDLPSRGDLAVTLDGRTLIQKVESRRVAEFESLEARTVSGFTAVIHPFRWEDAEITINGEVETPNWVPLRLWYLEWFQPRQTRLQPDLGAVVHALDGPDRGGASWRIRVDFGSAPVGALAALIEAVSETGASGLRIGNL